MAISNEAKSLANDLARCKYTLDDGVTKKDLENHLREVFEKDLGSGKTMYQTFRRNELTYYEIFEEIIDVGIGEDVLNSPFIDSFVEVKNRALGDKTAWYSEGGLLSVSSFAGNHWDTNRQAIDLGQEFTLPKEWIYIHVYEEFERFMLGITPLEKLMDKVYKSINKYMKDRIYLQFQNVASTIPTDFVKSGNTEADVAGLCDLVQAAGGYDTITIAGTRAALRRLTDIMPTHIVADSQKEALKNTGSIQMWDGIKLMVIPQALKSGTFQLALNDKQLFVMDGNAKPIKLEYIGDTRSKIVDDFHVNNDMTLDWQIQTCFGIGMILPQYTGFFQFP